MSGKVLAAPKNDVEMLINTLQDVADGDIGYSGTMTGTGFLPLGEVQSMALALGKSAMKSSRALRGLAERGAVAVPDLIAHLNDNRPTKVTITHDTGLGGMFFESEDDPNTTVVDRVLGHLSRRFSPVCGSQSLYS